jgi:hypothetical protein
VTISSTLALRVFLASNAASISYANTRRELYKVLQFLLEHQYVASGAVSDVWKVLLGSGQGLTASAAIANAAFLMSTEVGGPRLASKEFWRRWGILSYTRYVDNMLFVLSDSSCVQPLFHFLVTSLPPYSGKIEEIGTSHFDFLDVHYTFRSTDGQKVLDYAPILKLDGKFLHPSSAHPCRIHLSWPLGYIHSIWIRSCSLAIFQHAKDRFLTTLVHQHWPSELVLYFADNSVYDRIFNFRSPLVVQRTRAEQNVLWLVLPYHPIWESKQLMATAIRRINSAEHVRAMIGCAFGLVRPPVIKISWRITSPMLISSFNRET